MTVELRIKGERATFTAQYADEAFDHRAFMDAMQWPGREWEFGGEAFAYFKAGERLQITLPEFEFTVAGRVVLVELTTNAAGRSDSTMRFREDRDPA